MPPPSGAMVRNARSSNVSSLFVRYRSANAARRLGQSDPEVAVSLDQRTGRFELVAREALHDEGARGQIVDERQLDIDARADR